MTVIMMLGLAFAGAATWSVLNRPVTPDKRRNDLVSGVLLTASAVTLLAPAAWILVR